MLHVDLSWPFEQAGSLLSTMIAQQNSLSWFINALHTSVYRSWTPIPKANSHCHQYRCCRFVKTMKAIVDMNLHNSTNSPVVICFDGATSTSNGATPLTDCLAFDTFSRKTAAFDCVIGALERVAFA